MARLRRAIPESNTHVRQVRRCPWRTRDIEDMRKAVNEIVEDAVACAEASPEPPADWLTTDVCQD